ncbi:pyrroline-5-carboxylate reductase [Thalassobacillus devorans]|uniref:Pyrroline-5-carboxylate reductase n=1 Tax=Thalassobacillus devorans TaxID=279813 RepID=A0ABQ1P777_9BACI|nr:late competence protein ComER [Thalassobacillus devorans]NIK29720.1 competence protein ComER [Thalassobacillus devorans]GGC92266.1 pyrroline-5-carboxylate reductase [Thalassobacillus devorans]
MIWGVIGTGNMGSIVIESLIESGSIDAEEMIVTNRTLTKAYELKQRHPGLVIIKELAELVDQADIILLCVKPHDMKALFKDINGYVRKEQCVVSITSPVGIEELEKSLPCQVARIVPSITNRAFSGATLFSFSESVRPELKALLKQTFKFISRPIEIEEDYIRVCSDIVSCGPAFISFLMERWIKAAEEVADLPEETATELTTEMLIGYGKLLEENHYTLNTLREKVSVKGGVTGEGLIMLEQHIGELFEKMFHATQKKHKEDKKRLREP